MGHIQPAPQLWLLWLSVLTIILSPRKKQWFFIKIFLSKSRKTSAHPLRSIDNSKMNGRLGGIIQKVNQPKFINKHSVWSISIKENGKWTSTLTSNRKARRCGLFLCWLAETAQCLESWMKSKRPYNPNLNNQREVSFHLAAWEQPTSSIMQTVSLE